MNEHLEPPASLSTRNTHHSAPPSADLTALLKQPYRAGDAAYAAALWHATVRKLVDNAPAHGR